jgi:hypothetical protein
MIIYTSGRQGRRGRYVAHRSILWGTDAFREVNPFREDDEVVSYLPFAHVYENLVSVFGAVRTGYVVNFVESLDTLFQNLREVSPTYFASVPRIWEKLASTVELRMKDSTILKRTLYRWAVAVGRRYGRAKLSGRPVAPDLAGQPPGVLDRPRSAQVPAGLRPHAHRRLRRGARLAGAVRVLPCPGHPAHRGVRHDGVHGGDLRQPCGAPTRGHGG